MDHLTPRTEQRQIRKAEEEMGEMDGGKGKQLRHLNLSAEGL